MTAKEKIGAAEEYFRDLQLRLVAVLQEAEGAPFAGSEWQSALGRGRAFSLENGGLFERAGVNFSAVGGARLPPAASRARRDLANRKWRAAGVSLVCHAQNPFCPAAHLNVRFFSAGDSWWFGGGMDLTPCYGFAADCRHFHRACKLALDAHGAHLHPAFKKKCDEYFYLRHRGEMRGVGGVFFDDFREGGFARAFAVARAVGDSFAGAYIPILQKRRNTPFGKAEREWQLHRRGRYAEFNLLYDRGTLFGLQSGGNADAILMSLPPLVKWGVVCPGKKEKRLGSFLCPREWV